MAFRIFLLPLRPINKKQQVRITKNHNFIQHVALYYKGIGVIVCAVDSLTQRDEKNIANYLVVPNNFVLSLSLSLSLVEQA